MTMPETIGRYRILNEIIPVGIDPDEIDPSKPSRVYRAYDPSRRRAVALKALDTELAALKTITRFAQEAGLTDRINHPNVIRILDEWEDGNVLFIVMELMPLSLREALSAGVLPISRAVDICRQAALGLKAAHDRDVIHRDVKPDNILLDSKGVVKLADFGSARADNLRTITGAGERIGTWLYMSPEQWKGERVDVRSDIYSLGVVLHEMLTGEAPKAPYALAGDTPAVKQVRPSVLTGLERIVEKCMELAPERRYQTMDELIQAITALIDRCTLIDFYEATGGTKWERYDNWRTEAPLSDWHGVTADGDVVTGLSLSENNLDGTIPPELGNLTKLEELVLSDNKLSCEIPPELGNLNKLKYLGLCGDGLWGNVPPELGNLTELKWLDLSNNELSGNIPPELGNLNKMEELNLSRNQAFDGNIPPELGGLTKLKYLNISGNELSGNIPPELGNLTKLSHLFLFDNELSGSIPPEFGNLIALESLYLAENGLSGSIPPEFGNLIELESLDLADNALSGDIPPELGDFNDLGELSLSGNNWTGCIPKPLLNISYSDLDRIDLPVCDD